MSRWVLHRRPGRTGRTPAAPEPGAEAVQEPTQGSAGEADAEDPVLDLLADEPAMVDERVDTAVAVGVAALGVLMIWAAGDIRVGSIQDPIGAGGFARLLGVTLVLVGTLLTGRRLLHWNSSGDHLVSADGGSGDEPGHAASVIRPFVMLLIGLLWALLLPRVGYLVATALACLLGLLTMRVRSLPKLTLIPLAFSFVTWLLFTRVSGLLFPAGPVDLLLQQIFPRFG